MQWAEQHETREGNGAVASLGPLKPLLQASRGVDLPVFVGATRDMKTALDAARKKTPEDGDDESDD